MTLSSQKRRLQASEVFYQMRQGVRRYVASVFKDEKLVQYLAEVGVDSPKRLEAIFDPCNFAELQQIAQSVQTFGTMLLGLYLYPRAVQGNRVAMRDLISLWRRPIQQSMVSINAQSAPSDLMADADGLTQGRMIIEMAKRVRAHLSGVSILPADTEGTPHGNACA